MALTDIVFDTAFSSRANRGNIGTLVDIDFAPTIVHRLLLGVPAITDVRSGVTYGQQNTALTGNYAGGGGGGGGLKIVGGGGLAG